MTVLLSDAYDSLAHNLMELPQPSQNTTAVTVSKRALHKHLIYTCTEKKCASFTHKCAKPMSPVLTQRTCAEFSSVLPAYLCYFST